MCRVLKSRMKTCWALDLWTEFVYFFKKQQMSKKLNMYFFHSVGPRDET